MPLAARDAQMRERFAWLADLADIDAIVAAWDRDRAAPRWERAALGDPACDLSAAWTLFGQPVRAAFRAALGVDDATWTRGRGWALIEGVLALSYYRGKSDVLAREGRRVIDAVLADHAQ